MTDNSVDFKDFTRKRKPKTFKIEDDHFECIKALPVETTQVLTRIAQEINDGNAVEKLNEFFTEVLVGDGAERLRALMSDKTNPLDLDQATDILHWMLEVYGLRPTQSSSDSLSGSETGGDGTPSTAGASVAGSTLLG